MKILLTSLWIALATSTASAAAQELSEPVPSEARQSAKIAAPSPQTVELARRFIGLTVPADNAMDMVRAGAFQSASAAMENPEDASQRAAIERQVEQFLSLAEPKLREQLPNLSEAYAQAYAREFSAVELEQMIAFAQSLAGKHYLSQLAFLDNDPLVVAAADRLWGELAPVMRDAQKKKCAERAAKRVASGDTKATCNLG